MSNADDFQIAQAIGEVQGTLKVLLEVTQQNNQQLNQRMDDLTHAVNRRIDDHRKANDQRFSNIENQVHAHGKELEERQHDGKKAIGSGGVAALIVASSVEAAKALLGS